MTLGDLCGVVCLTVEGGLRLVSRSMALPLPLVCLLISAEVLEGDSSLASPTWAATLADLGTAGRLDIGLEPLLDGVFGRFLLIPRVLVPAGGGGGGQFKVPGLKYGAHLSGEYSVFRSAGTGGGPISVFPFSISDLAVEDAGCTGGARRLVGDVLPRAAGARIDGGSKDSPGFAVNLPFQSDGEKFTLIVSEL